MSCIRMKCNNAAGEYSGQIKTNILNILTKPPKLTGTRIPDPLFPHLVPPAIILWIVVWKYIFEPFIHILHFVLQLSRSTNFCFYVQLPLSLVKRQLDLETKVSRTSTSTRYRTLSLQTVTFRKKLLRCGGGKELKNEL